MQSTESEKQNPQDRFSLDITDTTVKEAPLLPVLYLLWEYFHLQTVALIQVPQYALYSKALFNQHILKQAMAFSYSLTITATCI